MSPFHVLSISDTKSILAFAEDFNYFSFMSSPFGLRCIVAFHVNKTKEKKIDFSERLSPN